MKKWFLFLMLASALCGTHPGAAQAEDQAPAPDATAPAAAKPGPLNENFARIHLAFSRKEAVAVLNDSPTSRDLLANLPMMLECGDYNHQEKLSYLPRKLDTAGAPETCTPQAGTIGYYIPWGSLAIFYHAGKPTSGLVPLGRVVSGLEDLANTHGDFYLRLDKLDQ